MKRPQGRPSKFTQAIADEICRRLAAGESLLGICKDDDMPAESTVRAWAMDDVQGFAAKYARARDIGLDHEMDEIREIADTCRLGEKITVEDGIDDQGNPRQKTVTVTADMVERAKLQIDARKFRLAKLAPKRYGDRLQLGDPDNPAATGISLVIMQAGQQDRPKE